MNPATDLDKRSAVERFARLSEDEQAVVMSEGRLIQSLEDLDGLGESDLEHFRAIIEEQTPTA